MQEQSLNETNEHGISAHNFQVMYTTITSIVYYFNVPASILGIAGNSISIAILRKHSFTETSNVLLLALCVNDLLICVCAYLSYFTGLLFTLPNISSSIEFLSIQNLFIFLTSPLLSVLISIGLLLTTAIAIERATAVCFPFHVSRIFTTARVKTLVALLCIFTFAIASPVFLRVGFRLYYEKSINATVATWTYLDIYKANRLVIDTYLVMLLGNVLVTLCLATILASTVAISVKLVWRKFRKLSSHVTTSKRIKHNKIIKVLMTICSITFISFLTSTILGGIMIRFSNELYYEYLGHLFRSIDAILYLLNPATNFIIYICMCKKFRSEFLRILTYIPRKFTKKQHF